MGISFAKPKDGISFAKPKDEGEPPIAVLQGRRVREDRALIGVILAAIGVMAMILVILLESNPIWITAWATLWTGWNVLCVGNMLRWTRTDYSVYRREQ
jgi:hypothetical protein